MGRSFDHLVGKHFDTLVHLLNKEHIRKGESNYLLGDVQEYLKDIVDRNVLFEFPLSSDELFPRSGKDFSEYVHYLNDYLELSHAYGKYLITPFPHTVVEDLDSVVFLDNIDWNHYRVTTCQHFIGKPPFYNNDHIVLVEIGDVRLLPLNERERFPMKIKPFYSAGWVNGQRGPNLLASREGVKNCANDLKHATMAYVQEVVYIEDPENFIIRKESGYMKQQQMKSSKKSKGKDRLQKKVLRPHYVCLSEDDTKDFLKGRSSEPISIHPVIGHWRHLVSERYVHKRGQVVPVSQHYRGQGTIEGKEGWRYQVMLKESPTKLVPFTGN